MISKFYKKQKGFTLIELLIVVAIIGILAAIAIPNLLTAMQRSKQKRTMADMRSIATSWEAYAVDNNKYTAAGYTVLGTAMGQTTLVGMLSPTYIKTLPTKDGWSDAYTFANDSNGQQYQIISYGKDNVSDNNPVGATTDFNCDIVYQNGTFTVFPEGKQQ